jgi:hypothetical protein
MDCLRSFIIKINQATTFSGADVKTWLLGVQEYWAVANGGNSIFNFQGFKNVDIYGIDVIGQIQTQLGAANGGVVEDWAFKILINGQLPLVSGNLTASPNYWNLQTSGIAASVALSKNTNSIKFVSPIKSVSFLDFEGIRVQGYGGQTAGQISLEWDLSFVIYYKYEGE